MENVTRNRRGPGSLLLPSLDVAMKGSHRRLFLAVTTLISLVAVELAMVSSASASTPSPTVTKVSPSSGAPYGGASVTITGREPELGVHHRGHCG
jgi:hypothetical protein